MSKLLTAGLACALLSWVPILSPSVQAAIITITTANDSGPGSLREAISLASNGDEIRFDSSLAGVPIILTTGELLRALAINSLGRSDHLQ